MFRNYIRIGLRNLLLHKGYTLIHLVGLSVSLAVTIMLVGFVKYELSFDKFHPKKDRIYRFVVEAELGKGKSLKAPMASLWAVDWVRQEVPEVEQITCFDVNPRTVQHNEKTFDNLIGAYTDSCFFQVFSFPFIAGDITQALSQPNGMVITERMAGMLFNNQNPLGQLVSYAGQSFEITGVLKQLPINSHMHFDFLLSVESLPDKQAYFQGRGVSTYVYFLLKKETNSVEVADKVADFVQQKTNELYGNWGLKVKQSYQSLNDIHLRSANLQYTMGNVGSIKHIYVMSSLAFFLILIAIINYVNMETARSQSRMKEIGVRKVCGAAKKQLISQFLVESLMLVFSSLVIALLAVELLTSGFEQLMNRDFDGYLLLPENILMYGGIAVIVSFLAGLYPAFILASFNPVKIFRFTSKNGIGRSALRVLLVVIQFTIATFLVIDLFILYHQIEFAKKKDLGFAKEQVLVLRGLTTALYGQSDVLMDELKKIPDVQHVTVASSFPGQMTMHNPMGRVDQSREEQMLVKINAVAHDYQQTLGIEMVEGRYFREGEVDSSEVVVNEKLAEMLDLTEPVIGKEVNYMEHRCHIIGVMKNYHVDDLRKTIAPVMHTAVPQDYRFVLVRVLPSDVDNTLKTIAKVTEELDPDYAFSYIFLNDFFAQMYQEEERLNRLSLLSALLAILIAVMGLYALTSFTVLRKRKEIGVRKAMGGSVRQVVVMLLKDINKWVLVAILLACPLAYFFMNNWLDNFEYAISITWEYFAVGGMATLGFAIAIVAGKAWQAAVENPANTLRDE